MRPHVEVLKRKLDELGISSDYSTFENRNKIQTGIYLSQLAGIDLGYTFKMYTTGPSCPELAHVCIEINNEMGDNMLAKDIITDDKTQTEMIKMLFGEIERLENRNNTLESRVSELENRVSELEKHVFEF